MVLHVMDTSEGAAWRFQLDAMLRVLGPMTRDAADAKDGAALRLIAALREAWEAAEEIELRAPADVAYKGVDLVKR